MPWQESDMMNDTISLAQRGFWRRWIGCLWCFFFLCVGDIFVCLRNVSCRHNFLTYSPRQLFLESLWALYAASDLVAWYCWMSHLAMSHTYLQLNISVKTSEFCGVDGLWHQVKKFLRKTKFDVKTASIWELHSFITYWSSGISDWSSVLPGHRF